ncbi:YybS family protein [Bacillus suaedaesalsae]|uniref:YybS family protein n=1 Tax=Bacillus suaedaesalsae TaxID=2810349 RepID=A0ABS2DH80_9BACI|nr:YybS family protein [Bacillus suaedaesalsae]MBM6616916.1 YybS family protein [Bacillus suaedaesalsae]
MGNTRVLTESAVTLALYSILLLMSLYVPILGLITFFLLALPFVVYTARRGWKNGSVLFIAATILTVLIGSLISIPIVILFGTSGVIIGYLYKLNKSRYEILAIGTIAFIVNLLLLYGILVSFMGIKPIEQFNVSAQHSLQTFQDKMSVWGQTLNENQIKQFEEAFELAPLLIPTVLVILATFLAFVTQLISTPILKRFNFKVEKWPPFREIKLPRSIIWYYLIVMILMMTQVIDKESVLYVGVINLFFVLELLMVIQGLSFIFFFSYHKKLSNGIPITILILSLFLPFLLYIVRIIGIIDLGFNIREEVKKSS